jgi:hypothetical protein
MKLVKVYEAVATTAMNCCIQKWSIGPRIRIIGTVLPLLRKLS